MPAQTIDHVIQQLEDIVDWSKRHESRLGYFAALYRKVTISVKKGIASGFFEDGKRLERLDVVFAERYIMAFEQYRSNQKTTRSWQLAFETSKHWWPIVLQHLLLGMNAHINLDLGIAAARTSPGDTLPSLKNDFDKINEILAALVDGVQQELARIWPLLGLLDRIGGRTDEALINFNMRKARDKAWKVAQELAPIDQAEQMSGIDQIDKEVARFGRVVRHPGLLVGAVNKIIRLGERGKVPQIIDTLNG
jgi:hypothetical protein